MSPTSSHLTLLGWVAGILARADIPHALIGGRALAVHGAGRATYDDDLLATDRRCLDPGLWHSLAESGAAIDVRRGDALDPLVGVVAFEKADEKPVDLVIGRGAWQAAVLERATPASRSEPLPVVRPADLILLKLYAGGPQDAWDILQLLGLPEREELVREVESRLPDLPEDCSAFWRKILST